MSCQQQILVANPPANSCIPAWLVTWLRSALSLNGDGCQTGTRIITSITQPSADDTNALWARVDENGCPLGDFQYYNGEWRKKPTVPVGFEGEYEGPLDGIFDPVSFEGIHGGQWDGWKVIFTDADKYPIIASGFNVGTGEWVSGITGVPLNVGGSTSFTLTLGQVPRNVLPAINLGRKGAPTVVRPGDGALYGFYPDSGATLDIVFPGDPGNAAPTPVSLINPFVAKARVKYLGICL